MTSKSTKKLFIITIAAVSLIEGCAQSHNNHLITEINGEQMESATEETKENTVLYKSVMVCRKNEPDCFYFPSDTLASNYAETFEDLMWIASRGGAGISGEDWLPDDNALTIIKLSDQIIQDTDIIKTDSVKLENDNTQTWVRINYDSYIPASGVNEFPHKDVIMATAEDSGENAFIAIQNPKDLSTWKFIKLPGYGQWLERELDMLLYQYTGF